MKLRWTRKPEMTHVGCGTGGFMSLALAVALLSTSGCRSNGCALGCGNPGAIITVPNSTPDDIGAVETQPPCVAERVRENSQGQVRVSLDAPGTCQVHVYLTNGDTYAFSVEFGSRDFYCCGTVVYPVDTSVPGLVVGGADGGTEAGAGVDGTSGDTDSGSR